MGDDHAPGTPREELSGELGPPDAASMRAFRDVFLANEPLVAATTFDSTLRPRELQISLSDGLGAANRCRLDVSWYRTGAPRCHYVDDDGVDWRFDRHPNPHSPEKHFHEPPSADSRPFRPVSRSRNHGWSRGPSGSSGAGHTRRTVSTC